MQRGSLTHKPLQPRAARATKPGGPAILRVRAVASPCESCLDRSACPAPIFANRLLFREDAYLEQASARVIGVHDGFLILDATLFYPASGGQPSDMGTIRLGAGPDLPVTEMRYLDAGKKRSSGTRPARAGA